MWSASIFDVPDSESVLYATDDAVATYLLYNNYLKKRIADRKIRPLLDMDMGVVAVAARMQRNGMLVDQEHFHWLSGYLQDLMVETQAGIDRLVGHVEPDSADQVADLLFEKLQVQKGSGVRLRRTPKAGRYQADDKALQAVVKLHPVVPLILEYRKYSKLKGTFVDKLPTMVDYHGRIHTQLKLTRVVSGRFASANPNLQQIPTEGVLGNLVRCGFIAPPGRRLCSIDLQAIEMRVAAHLADDRLLVHLFTTIDPETGQEWDIHAQTASRIFGKPASQIDKKTERYPCKSAGFLILYGGTAGGLADYLTSYGLPSWTEDRAQELIDEWFRIYSGIKAWVKDIHSHARLYGWVDDMFGRRLWCPQVWSTIPKIREEGLRLSQNMPVQSGAAGILKLATAKAWQVYKSFWQRGLYVEPLMSVHDEIISELDSGQESVVEKEMVPCFEGAIALRVPVRAGVAFANSWGEMDK